MAVNMVCLDLEGVLVPEIWIAVAEATGVEGLRLTTRDLPDYDELMSHRLGLLERHGIDLHAIQGVIAGLSPLPGAVEFLEWARARFPLVILSDTFYEFADPLMRQLGRPLLLCHDLEVDTQRRVRGYRLRQREAKRRAVEAFRGLDFRVLAAGDSYNDVQMLAAADAGVLFRPPARLVDEFPGYPVVEDHAALREALERAATGTAG